MIVHTVSFVEREVNIMIHFANTFLSYVVLMLIIVALGGAAIAVGIILRKKKNAKEENQENTEVE